MPRSNQKAFMDERRKAALEFLGGACSQCGGLEDLHFHHIDKKTKSFVIASGLTRSQEVFWAEVKKCVLLCKDCHGKKHGMGNHGIGGYERGCRCEICRETWNEYRRYRRSLGKK